MPIWEILLIVGVVAVIGYVVVRKLFGFQLGVLKWMSNPLGA